MKIADKRIAGAMLGRGGMSQRIIQLANEIASGTYKDAIEKAGRIAVIVEAATCDDYWNEKALLGKISEQDAMCAMVGGLFSREDMLSRTEETP